MCRVVLPLAVSRAISTAVHATVVVDEGVVAVYVDVVATPAGIPAPAAAPCRADRQSHTKAE